MGSGWANVLVVVLVLALTVISVYYARATLMHYIQVRGLCGGLVELAFSSSSRLF